MKQDFFNQMADKIKEDNKHLIAYYKKEQVSQCAFFINRKSQGIDFVKYVQYPGYAADTLINGNISHCIEYIQQLICCGIGGMSAAHDELLNIKDICPDRYDYIKSKVFSL